MEPRSRHKGGSLNTGKVLGPTATTLRNAVHAVQAALDTYNRFLEGWPLEA
jgi:hypothetical protein